MVKIDSVNVMDIRKPMNGFCRKPEDREICYQMYRTEYTPTEYAIFLSTYGAQLLGKLYKNYN